MTSSATTLDEELRILFGSLCNGLHEEAKVRRQQAKRVHDPTWVSMTAEREAGIASALAIQLRKVDFFAQVEAYVPNVSLRRRPDLRIWLPKSKKYIYLELKTYGWGVNLSYYYATTEGAVMVDMTKLANLPLEALPNGLVVVGFSKLNEDRLKMPLSKAYEELSDKIVKAYPYQQVGVQQIDLQGMDNRTGYAMMGLWVRKS